MLEPGMSSLWQDASHPSPEVVFPSSQSSPGSTVPFPHGEVGVGANVGPLVEGVGDGVGLAVGVGLDVPEGVAL
jgi:hypothetical protein